MQHHLISLMILLPILGAIFQAFIQNNSTAKWCGFALSLASSVVGVVLIASLAHSSDPQFVETLPWVGSYAINYQVAIDGMNVLLVLLVSILFPVLLASEWTQKLGSRGIVGLFLILQAAFLGTVCAQDLFLLFFFWGLTAVPVYFLIGIWGKENREQAAFQTIVSSSIGNAFFFAGMLLVYYTIESHSFLLSDLSGGKFAGKTFEILGNEFSVAPVAFALMSLGLAFRAPVWPLHGWFTRAARESSSSVFVVLAALSIPVANYIFFRVCYPLFPALVVSAGTAIIIIGSINLLLGAVCALAQNQMRSLLAYASIGQVGIYLIGMGSLSSSGLVGSIYNQVAVSLGFAGFGLLIGIIESHLGRSVFTDGKKEKTISGLVSRAPTVAVAFGLTMVSLLALPGMAGFVGQSLVVIGVYPAHPVIVVFIAVAMLLAIYYMFHMYRSVFFGKVSADSESMQDATWIEKSYLTALVVCLVVFGLYPKPFLDLMRPTVLTLLSSLK